MIGTIKTCIDITCTVINYSLYISFKIGHFLVNILSLFQNILLKFAYLLLEVFGAVFESFTTFYQDVVQNFQHVLRTISSVDIITYLSDIKNIVQSLVFVIVSLSDFMVKIVVNIATGIYTVLLSPKYLGLYLNNILWSIILAIKEGFSDLSTLILGSIHYFSQKAKDFIKASTLFWTNLPHAVYDFLTEVPVESILAITISCCLIYLFARFYIIMFSFLYRQLNRFFWNIRHRYIAFGRYFSRSALPERAVYRRQVLPTRRPHIRTERNPVSSSKSEEGDRCCVICQEHIKCVLLLPCRHLCMCNQCVNTLQIYNNTCPICRSDIESTMQIFV